MTEGIETPKRPDADERLRVEIRVDEASYGENRQDYEDLRAKEARLEEVLRLDDLAGEAGEKSEKWMVRRCDDAELQRRIDELARAYARLQADASAAVKEKASGPEGVRVLAESASRYAKTSLDEPQGAGLLAQILRFERLAGRPESPPQLEELLANLAHAALAGADRESRAQALAELASLPLDPLAARADARIRKNAETHAR